MTVPFNYFKRATACITAVTGLLLGAASLDADILYQDSGSFTVDGATDGNNDSFVSGTFDEQSGNVYVAYDITYNGTDIGSNDFIAVWLESNAYPTGASVGIKGNQVSDVDSNPDIFARTVGSTEAWASGFNVTPGSTFTILAEISKSGTGNYDTYTLWVNPIADSFAIDAVSSGDSGYDAISSWGVRTVNLTGEDSFTISGLTIASTMNEAIGVIPEPSTWALSIGLLAIGGFIYRRRRN